MISFASMLIQIAVTASVAGVGILFAAFLLGSLSRISDR